MHKHTLMCYLSHSHMPFDCTTQGATKPGHEMVGEVHVKQVYEIARIKQREPPMHMCVFMCACVYVCALCVCGSCF